MTQTTVAPLSRDCESYILITLLGRQAHDTMVAPVQTMLAEAFGQDAFWLPDGTQSHITFAHILSPDAEYATPPGEIFAQIKDAAIASAQKTFGAAAPVTVTFDTVEAFPGAIILKGHDDGTIDRLRSEFISGFDLPEGSRKPPAIIHTTVARYKKPLNLEAVQTLVASKPVSHSFTVSKVQLICERQMFMDKFEVLETFDFNKVEARLEESHA